MDIKMFDNVKYEKEKAMERFNKFQKMKRILKVLQSLFVFLLLVWSMKNIVRFSRKLFEVSVCFLNPHLAFLIGNFIILALFLLCKQPAAGNSSNQEYSSHREASRKAFEVTVTAPRMPLTSPEVMLTSPEDTLTSLDVELTSPDVELTSPDVALTSPEVSLTYPVEMLTSPEVVTGVAEDNVKSEEELKKVEVENEQCEAAEVVIAAAEQDIRRFERTLSEKLKKEIVVRPRKELRRSETENWRLIISSGGGGGGRKSMVTSSLKKVEHLSNEEFKLAIDAFIDKHRVFSKEKINAELGYK